MSQMLSSAVVWHKYQYYFGSIQTLTSSQTGLLPVTLYRTSIVDEVGSINAQSNNV